MKKWLKIISGVILFVLIIGITVTFLSYRLLKKSLPQTSGEIHLTILDDSVKVYRDKYGVPHIFAKNELDLFRAAGYVTAQDRLWQMDFNRRLAAGRLSEIFGKKSLTSDKFLRIWGFERIARKLLPRITAEARAILQAYADGVNAFIETHLDRLPVEFTLLRYKPEKWRMEDSIAYARLMAWRLSFAWYVEPVLAQLVEKFGYAKASELFPGFPKEGPFIIPPETRPFWSSVRPFMEAGLALREFLGMGSAPLGSNSWVVSGKKSVCGKPLLANDPHLELSAPSVWYEMHLKGGDIDVAGVSLPGIPGIVIGHNRFIAWGLTNGMVDDVDFYRERVNPENSNQYWTSEGWRDFDIIREKIAVKNQDTLTMEIRFSRNGPIVNSIHPVMINLPDVLAMKWTGYQFSDETTAFLKLQKARNWQEFVEAVSYFKVPAQNFIFASVDGDIGYYLGGRVPLRQNAKGFVPHAGWQKRGQWVGEIPFEKLPHVLNPSTGYLATANNKIIDDRYPFYITHLWEPPSRSARINELLTDKEKFTLEDFKSIQQDLVSVHARTVLPVLKQAIQAKLSNSSTPDLETLYNLIKDWDGEETPESVATSIFHAFFIKLTENTLKDDLGERLYKHYIHIGNVPYRVMVALLRDEKSPWFDDIRTPEKETRNDILVKSLLDAGQWLKELAGEEISYWRWGEIHQLTMRHPMGRQRPLDVLLNLGPFPRGGSTMTINNSEYPFDHPFEVHVGPSTRQLVDFCDINKSLAVIPTGQSGQWISKHYKDQNPLWLNGQYHSMPMDSTLVVQSAVEVLNLLPPENH